MGRNKVEREILLKQVGSNLKKWRSIRGFSRKEVADSAGIIPQQYYGYEKGSTEPGVVTAYKMANVLGISLQDMLIGEGISIENETPKDMDFILAKLTLIGFKVEEVDGKVQVKSDNSEFVGTFTLSEITEILNRVDRGLNGLQFKLTLYHMVNKTLWKKRAKLD